MTQGRYFYDFTHIIYFWSAFGMLLNEYIYYASR